MSFSMSCFTQTTPNLGKGPWGVTAASKQASKHETWMCVHVYIYTHILLYIYRLCEKTACSPALQQMSLSVTCLRCIVIFWHPRVGPLIVLVSEMLRV